jgi:flagellar hook-associated protein 3 FlgL
MNSERITSGMLAASTLNSLNNSLASLERSSEEMSSGKTILEPSDNPYGASQVIELQSQLQGLSSYATNVTEGISWEQTSSGALSNISSIAQRVRELLVQSSNGSNTTGDRNAIATEVGQLTEAVKQDANTQFAGQYVFSGTATITPPYKSGEEDAYQGDAGTITRAIGPSATVVVNTNISTLLGSGQGAADGKLLDTLRTITEHLKGGTPEDIAALSSTDLTSLDANIETATSLQATVGSVTDQMQMAASRIEGLQTSVTATLSETEDANLAQVAIAYSNEQAGYQAALRAGASIMQESLLNFLH